MNEAKNQKRDKQKDNPNYVQIQKHNREQSANKP
jgi:hypothetical protein